MVGYILLAAAVLVVAMVILFRGGSNVHVRGFEICKGAPEDTQLPVRGSMHSAGYDMFAPYDICIPAHGFSQLVPLGIKAYMREDEYLALVIRSSFAIKEAKGNLMVSQGTAVIDSDYYENVDNDGNIGVMFYNRSNHDVIIPKGDRCCQAIFMPFLIADNDMSLGNRTGGYGSSGTK